MKEEIDLLLKARRLILDGHSYICLCLDMAAGRWGQKNKRRLEKEVMEFLDGEHSVRFWLDGCSREMVRTYQLAIIDTLLARRDVRLPPDPPVSFPVSWRDF